MGYGNDSCLQLPSITLIILCEFGQQYLSRKPISYAAKSESRTTLFVVHNKASKTETLDLSVSENSLIRHEAGSHFIFNFTIK